MVKTALIWLVMTTAITLAVIFITALIYVGAEYLIVNLGIEIGGTILLSIVAFCFVGALVAALMIHG